MLKLYEFYWDCGRQGDLDGLFVADDADVQSAFGKSVYFGEVLGKHSEIYGMLEEHDLRVISDDQEKIEWLVNLLGSSVSGFNPLDYINEDDEDES